MAKEKEGFTEEAAGFTEETEGFTEEAAGFESKLQNAKKILETLMNPDITLSDSVKAYEKGMKELTQAQKILEEAEIKITQIKG
jgi:exodeoxyribonuclease VII small subunit